MEKKTFTEKLISLIVSGNMPNEEGGAAAESGLIILTSNKTAPVGVIYGSSLDIEKALSTAMVQCEPLRAVLAVTVVAYATEHPEDPFIAGIKDFME